MYLQYATAENFLFRQMLHKVVLLLCRVAVLPQNNATTVCFVGYVIALYEH
jgi:hypothetical protein